MKLTTEQIEKAINWWADRVTTPTFDALSNDERKDHNNDGMIFAEILAYLLVKPIEKFAREKFIFALREELQKEDTRAIRGLFVDYGPDLILSEAAKSAGISENNFPWKTCMWFRDGKVIVALGYRAEPIEL
jgi:hypothetical protein